MRRQPNANHHNGKIVEESNHPPAPSPLNKSWGKMTHQERQAYPVPDDREDLSQKAGLFGLVGIAWLGMAFGTWKLIFLNTIWIGKCAYCMDADGSIWWGLLTPVANFGAFFPAMLAILYWWWSENPTPQWRRSEMFGWLFAATLFAPFWFMLSWIAFDLHTWVEGVLHISNNYQFEDPNIYWTFAWIAIPAVGGLAILPLYFSWKALLYGLQPAPPLADIQAPEEGAKGGEEESGQTTEEEPEKWWE